MIPGDSIAVDEALLVLKVLFLVLLYLFIWRIVRSASKDVRLPQESFILRPDQAQAAGLAQAPSPIKTGTLVVLKSPALEEGTRYELDSAALTIGVRRLPAPPDGAWATAGRAAAEESSRRKRTIRFMTRKDKMGIPLPGDCVPPL